MWQNIAVAVILLLAAFFVARKYLRMIQSEKQGNSCGCDCNCDGDESKPGSGSCC